MRAFVPRLVARRLALSPFFYWQSFAPQFVDACPLMFPGDYLIDQVLMPRVGLDPIVVKAEGPPALSRLLLEPIKYTLYGCMVFLLSVGNVCDHRQNDKKGWCVMPNPSAGWVLVSWVTSAYALFISITSSALYSTDGVKHTLLDESHLQALKASPFGFFDFMIVTSLSWDQFSEHLMRYLAGFTTVFWILIFVGYTQLAIKCLPALPRLCDKTRNARGAGVAVCAKRRLQARGVDNICCPVILASAWIHACLINAMLCFVAVSVGTQMKGWTMYYVAPFSQLLDLLKRSLLTPLEPALLALEVCTHDEYYAKLLSSIVYDAVPEVIALLPGLANGFGIGMVIGSVLGMYMTVSGVYSTWQTYVELYRFFWQHGERHHAPVSSLHGGVRAALSLLRQI